MADIQRARQLRQVETWAEKLMWRWLRDRRFGAYKFRRQHPLGLYCLDFFCEEAELNIELDGSQHGFPEQRKHGLASKKRTVKSSHLVNCFWFRSQLGRGNHLCMILVLRMIVRSIPPLVWPKTRRARLFLLGEKAGLREVLNLTDLFLTLALTFYPLPRGEEITFERFRFCG
jgi:very-short-patch-repair endonuclease